MRRAALLTLFAVLVLAQSTRDGYRAAYRTWRETDPNLERDAAAGGAAIAQRADRMAGEAAKFVAARKAFLDGVAAEETAQGSWFASAPLPVAGSAMSVKADAQFVAAETARVTRTINTFASDPDKGIQQLRQALARERAALDALGTALTKRKPFADAVSTTTQKIEQARSKAAEQSRAMLAGMKDAEQDAAQEAAAWAEYYRKIGEGAEGSAVPITEAPPGVPTVTLNNPVPAPPTITPVPLVRYIGEWIFPDTNGLFHGAQPEAIDMVVSEEGGHMKGNFAARFKLPPGSSGEPALKFDFSGDIQPTRNQVFNLLTSDGTKGTVELIPGPAFNLLEVNFQTEAKTGKVRQADVILVKK